MKFAASLAILAAVVSASTCSWPYSPFSTSGRWILNSNGEKVLYAGTNWPGAGETMVPEGLQYASVSSIVSGIKSLGMNVIRLTFAIEMVDDVYAGGDKTLKEAFESGLGAGNGSIILQKVLANNPQFNENTTRIQVFDAIAAECFKQEIYVHLDNHISKAQWCCSSTDGNGWFGDVDFNVSNWKRGLQYMAKRGADWGNLMSIGLRNELRNVSNNAAISKTYNWETWYANMIPAAKAVHDANNDVIVFLSGLNYDLDLSAITLGTDLGNGTKFVLSDFSYKDKLVLEQHFYPWDVSSSANCTEMQEYLYEGGFNALDENNKTVVNHMPVVLSEWGHDFEDVGLDTSDSYTYYSVYAECMNSFLPKQNVGWMIWTIVGSYYTRQSILDFDETWGIYNHNFSDWRSQNATQELKNAVAATHQLQM
ncbi:hypothetical protein HDU82_005035 [Entophlyctis luteolus]|nr:hypothetical protein HDU82_005035 [Entophlyctis luteolus]